MNEDHHLETFASLDDTDIMASVKVWAYHPDFTYPPVAKTWCSVSLFRVDISNKCPDKEFVKASLIKKAMEKYGISYEEAAGTLFLPHPSAITPTPPAMVI
jgi:hypothetical protein